MNDKKGLNPNFNLEEIFIDFDYRNKRSKKTSALMFLFEFMSLTDFIFLRNSNKFFHSKLDMDFLKKVIKKKLLNRKEITFVLKKIIISPE